MIAKKKTKKADLEGKRFAFFQIGLVVAGALTLAAFEYSGVRFNELAKTEFETDAYANLMGEQPKEFIVETKQKVKLKVVLPVYDEVKPVDKLKEEKASKQINEDLIKELDIDGSGEPDGDLDGKIVQNGGDGNTVLEYASVMPEFPGGIVAMNKWIANNIDLPYYAEPLGGTIYVEFVVDKKGEITKVKLSNKLHQDYDNACLAVVSKMPKWTPGEQAGKNVNVRYHLPIKFVSH
jgi:protein TonB